MEIAHAFPQVKAVGIRAELVACNLNLRAAKILCDTASAAQHLFPDALPLVAGRHGKLHNLRNACGMVELRLKP